jgi:hypothetical protein
MFGLTRGEIILVAFIFALVYGAGLLPKLVALVTGTSGKAGKPGAGSASPDD